MTAIVHIKDHETISTLQEQFANNVYPNIKKGVEQGKTPQDFYEKIVEGYGDDISLSMRDFKIGAYFGMVAVGYKEQAIVNEKVARLVV